MSEHHSRPYSIRLFVPDGNPNSLKIIQKMNWTGVGLEISRNTWEVHKNRNEFNQAGVYILIGHDEESNLPILYVGQGDVVNESITTHYNSKTFWDRALVFVSTNGGLNRGHTTWLEWMLIKMANETDRCEIGNNATAKEPLLSEYEKADTQEFLNEILSLFPFVNIEVFETSEKVEVKSQEEPKKPEEPERIEEVAKVEEVVKEEETLHDTLIVPAHEDDFKKIFLAEDCWYPIPITERMLKEIKYIAAYQTPPVSAITYCAEVESIEPYEGNGEYKLNFKIPAQKINPIEFGDAKYGVLQEPAYTDLQTLLEAETIKDIFEN